jgi:hypothetical protein
LHRQKGPSSTNHTVTTFHLIILYFRVERKRRPLLEAILLLPPLELAFELPLTLELALELVLLCPFELPLTLELALLCPFELVLELDLELPLELVLL